MTATLAENLLEDKETPVTSTGSSGENIQDDPKDFVFKLREKLNC